MVYIREEAVANETSCTQIASLKCGGQALNLTCANRVLIIDPWWNVAMEKQAFGRVARIGQLKPTYLAKFVVNETVEASVIELQDIKTEDIAKTLKEKVRVSKASDFRSKLLGGIIGLQLKGTKGFMNKAPEKTAAKRADKK